MRLTGEPCDVPACRPKCSVVEMCGKCKVVVHATSAPWPKIKLGKMQYLDNKVAPLAVQEHLGHPADFSPYFVPDGAEADLIPGGETVNFIEPKTCEEVRDGDMFSDDHTAFRDVCTQCKREKIDVWE